MTIDWSVVAKDVSAAITAVEPFIPLAGPVAPELTLVAAILKGVAAAEPTAVALITQLKSGTPITAQQAQDYYSKYKADDDALAADIAARLKGA